MGTRFQEGGLLLGSQSPSGRHPLGILGTSLSGASDFPCLQETVRPQLQNLRMLLPAQTPTHSHNSILEKINKQTKNKVNLLSWALPFTSVISGRWHLGVSVSPVRTLGGFD